MKNLNQIDLNLLVYLEVLLRERNVTQAANQLGLSEQRTEKTARAV